MYIRRDVSLKKYSTMRLGGVAAYLCNINTREDIPNAIAWAATKKLPVLMIGGGSNIFWSDSGFRGLVMVNKIKGYTSTTDQNQHYIRVGAGETWDEVVAKTTRAKLHGIEALSLIPGTVGGTPVQNVGAYGQEIADTLVSVEAYDKKHQTFVTIPKDDCEFGYRTSRFKTVDKGRFFITHITLCLTKQNPAPPFYAPLQTYLDHLNITSFTPQTIREVVIAIRSSKLPDPAKVANNGSFFANPVVSEDRYQQLQNKYSTIPGWPSKHGMIKIPAAWLIEQAGFKNFHDRKTGMATWHTQPLVLVNEKAGSTSDLLTFRDRIIHEVQEKFNVALIQEPELLP